MVDNQALIEACMQLDADVVCLQEVDRNQVRSGRVDQTRLVAEALGAAHWRFQPALVGEPGGQWRPARAGDEHDDAPAYGVAMVARTEVVDWSSMELAPAPVRSPVVVPGGRGRFLLLADEPRACLVAHLPAGPTTGRHGALVATTHLSFVPGYNLVQLRRICRGLAGTGHPVLLAGDLNAPGRLVQLALAGRGWTSLLAGPTYPAGSPRFQLDGVLAKGPVSGRRPAERLRVGTSDHLAVVAEVVVGGDLR